jgi:UDP-N-acetylmuramoyl-tripeptide--D-alanyl-D-alanine ligase
MIPLALDEIAELAPGRLQRAPGAERATGVTIDSRRTQEGDLFVAVGAGVDFVGDALAAGAVGALVPEDAFGALGALGQTVRLRSATRVVAVTGSTAKTSTKDILGALCSPHARTVVAEGSQNNEIGLPLTLCRLEEDTEVAIVEMACAASARSPTSARSRGRTSASSRASAPCLELRHGRARGAGKGGADRELPPGAPLSSRPARPISTRTLRATTSRFSASATEGTSASATSRRTTAAPASASRPSAARSRSSSASPRATTRRTRWRRWPPTTRWGSRSARRRRARGTCSSRACAEGGPLAGGGILLNDCYNANRSRWPPRSSTSTSAPPADTARSPCSGHGRARPRAPAFHREVGAAAARAGVEVLVAVGPLARNYVQGARGVPVTRWAPTVEQGLAALRTVLQPGDCVLVKGSRAMGLEVIAEAVAVVPARA